MHEQQKGARLKYLYLFRHADTLPPEGEQSDHERVLSDLGQEECVRIGSFLKQEKLRPDFALCSTAVRTRTTLGLVAKTLGSPIEARFEHALYLASPGDMFHMINGLDNTLASAMMVGHNPGIHQMCMMLARKGDAEGVSALSRHFPPASLALFRLEIDAWNQLSPHSDSELVGLVIPSKQPSY
jgi:phosphohistidine phosphatase